jgi:hypothetical protein
LAGRAIFVFGEFLGNKHCRTTANNAFTSTSTLRNVRSIPPIRAVLCARKDRWRLGRIEQALGFGIERR